MSINELDAARAAFAADVAAVVEQTERITELEQELHDLRNDYTRDLFQAEIYMEETRQVALNWKCAALRLSDYIRKQRRNSDA